MTFSMPHTVWVLPVPGGPWTRVKGHGSCLFVEVFVVPAAVCIAAQWIADN